MKLIHQIFNTNKKHNIALLIMIIYSMSLLIIRAKITQTVFLFFLIWNLFLAIIPYLIMIYLKTLNYNSTNKLKSYLMILIWIVFLPNSFYIITDLIHLSKSDQSTFWYDLILIGSFSIVGFFLGIQSIFEFEKIAKKDFNSKKVDFIIPLLCFLCGLGIYLGRILRYNSWDIISNPLNLSEDIASKIMSSEMIFFSANFGIFIYIFYVSKKIIFNSNN
jgi:uncharacterized membrane protein